MVQRHRWVEGFNSIIVDLLPFPTPIQIRYYTGLFHWIRLRPYLVLRSYISTGDGGGIPSGECNIRVLRLRLNSLTLLSYPFFYDEIS